MDTYEMNAPNFVVRMKFDMAMIWLGEIKISMFCKNILLRVIVVEMRPTLWEIACLLLVETATVACEGRTSRRQPVFRPAQAQI